MYLQITKTSSLSSPTVAKTSSDYHKQLPADGSFDSSEIGSRIIQLVWNK